MLQMTEVGYLYLDAIVEEAVKKKGQSRLGSLV